MKKTLLFVCFSLTVALSARAIAFYDLGTLPSGTHSLGYGVSDVGNVAVGVSIGSAEQAFRWSPGAGMSGLGYMAGYSSSVAYDVSGDGSIVVGYNLTAAGQAQAFRWSQSSGMTGLGYLGRNYSTASAVSADGSVITGQSGTTSGWRAFRWTQSGGMQNLGTLAGDNTSNGNGVSGDGSTIVGQSYYLAPSPAPSSGGQAFRWTQAGGMVGLGWLPGDNSSQAIGASTDGSVIVGISKSASGQAGFRWTLSQGMMSLGLYEALGVSGDGSVVVGSIGNGAAIWDAAHGVQELRNILLGDGIDLNNWTLASAQDISADGLVITGVGQYGSELRAWMVVVPEPTSATLLVLSLLLICRHRQILPRH